MISKKVVIIAGVVAAAAIAGTAVYKNLDNIFPEKIDSDFTVSYEGISLGSINASASVHDPSIIKDNGMFYIFGTHLTAASSEDLRKWTYLGNGYNAGNKVYGDLFTNDKVFEYTGKGNSIVPTDDGGCHLWAPDVIYNEAMGKYLLYYCTSSTWNASTLEYASADSIEGPYEFEGNLIYSGITPKTLEYTDVLDYVSEDYANENYIKASGEYNFDAYPNALDPTVFYDKDGKMWMVYGSWSGGIFLLELDEQTGQVIHPEADPENNVDAYFGKKLMGGGHKSIEGPYIIYDADSDYYYLFVSYGTLTSQGGYQIRVFRSKTVDGEYVDMNGQTPFITSGNHAYFGLKLSGNYRLPSLMQAYMATGHNSALIDEDTGKKYIAYHTRFESSGENHSPRVKQYFLNEEGWPCMLPYATSGETITNDISISDVAGEYYVVNQGTAIDNEIAEPIKLVLSKRGIVYGDGIEGTWTLKDGSYYMTITYNEVTYSGVFCAQEDEAGTEVMTFSAVGANTSVWGVKYNE
ncbi:MAG: glycoside hydrolase family 43 protein [Butyrivibrio sp.]|nr:glycoside hydrolase family 43 protein [Butyrivibrio sp.]